MSEKSDMNLNVITDMDGLVSLKDDWNRLFEQSNSRNIFVSWDWCYAWWKHFGSSFRLYTMVVTDGSSIKAIAPLMEGEGTILSGGKRIISFLGDSMMADYMDILATGDKVRHIGILLEHLFQREGWGIIRLGRFLEPESSLEVVLEGVRTADKKALVRLDCVSPYVEIQGGWEAYYAGLSKKLKQDIRTSVNKLNKLGQFRYVPQEQISSAKALETLYGLHANRQKDKVGDSIFKDSSNRAFIEEVVENFGKKGWSDVSALELNGEYVSVALSLRCGGTYYYWIPTFDEKFGNISLGKLHIFSILKDAFENRTIRFDFMIGDEKYKYLWTSQSWPNYEVIIYGSAWIYEMNRAKYSLRGMLKKMKNSSSILQKAWKVLSKCA